MTDAPRVVVIGAGAAGTATAAAAACRGAHVTVIDRDGVAAGSSGLSAGVFTTTYADPLEVELRAFCIREIERLARDAELPVVRNGFLRLARRDRELSLFERAVAVQRTFGIDDSRVLEPPRSAPSFPHLDVADLAGALWAPSDGYMDGRCAVHGQPRSRAGARRRLRARHRDARRDRPAACRLDRHRRDSVRCDRERRRAGAAGIGELLGCPMPILNERHQLVFAHLAEPLAYVMPTVMDYVPGGEQGLYLRHEGDTSRLLVGLHANESGLEPVAEPDAFRRAVDGEYLEEVACALRGACRRWPGWAWRMATPGCIRAARTACRSSGPIPDGDR